MPLYDLYAILGMCAKMSCRAILTYFGIALVFSVSVSVGRTVCKRMVLGTNDAIVMLIVYVLPPFVSAVHCLRSFVCRTENTIVIKYLFANMGSFVSTVCYNGFYLGKPFGHFFIYVIKCYATSACIFFLLFAFALMCVPSMNTAVGDRYPASAISFKIQENI